jgi:hypothetical protein
VQIAILNSFVSEIRGESSEMRNGMNKQSEEKITINKKGTIARARIFLKSISFRMAFYFIRIIFLVEVKFFPSFPTAFMV